VSALVHAPRLEAHEPPESRGVDRAEVAMLVATRHELAHARFRELPQWLSAGDLLVVNT
jgi:S-adenosylmethionine:tRNA ribosyltransferase-isomerase